MIPLPTKNGYSLILLGFMLYLASITSASGLLFLVLGILFGLYLINLIGAMRSCRALKFYPPASVSCSESEKLPDTWTVSNSSKHTAGFVTLEGKFGELLKVGAVPAGGKMHLTPDLTMDQRGIYPYGSLQATSSFPFGLLQCHRTLPMEGEIVVYPSVYPCSCPPAAGFEPMVGGKFSGQNRTSSGDSFHGVRPYQSSDPVKLIHWRSSAKGMGMMSKEFDEELSGRVGLMMDCTPRRAPDGSNLLDWAARAAASLMLAALDEGHQVEFIRLGDQNITPVPPFADGSEVMDALARIKEDASLRTVKNLEESGRHIPPKSSLCLVLTGVDESVREFIGLNLHSRRSLVVYVPSACWDEAADLPVPVRAFEANSMAEEWMHR